MPTGAALGPSPFFVGGGGQRASRTGPRRLGPRALAEHWQSIWQVRNPNYRRVEQQDWNGPDLEGWLSSLEIAVREAPSPVVLVAHSLACSLVADWAERGSSERVDAATLVSPTDVDSDAHTPPEAAASRRCRWSGYPFGTSWAHSSNEPYVDPERARYFAQVGGRL